MAKLICGRWGRGAIKQLLHKHLKIETTAGKRDRWWTTHRSGNSSGRKVGLVSELNRLKVELANHMLPPPPPANAGPHPGAKKEVLDDIAVAASAILLTDQELDRRIRFGGWRKKLLRLNREKKRFLDCIKVFACNLQAQMCRLLLKHYDWRKEVVPALAMIVERTGYLKLERGRLEVTLRRFMDREIDYAARHLCEDLNAMGPVTLDRFHLPIRYSVQ